MKTATKNKYTPKPVWLKKKLPVGNQFQQVNDLLKHADLHTVCQEANCPNRFECFSQKTATIMILGPVCSRHCRFCNVASDLPEPVDPDEPRRVAQTIQSLGLKYAVITSVTRDDLEDGGAAHFASVISAVKAISAPRVEIEVLIPDFQGSESALKSIINAAPDVVNHNIETIPDLYEKVRPQADYTQSLTLLSRVRSFAPHMPVKSGVMVGFGESFQRLQQVFEDLFAAGCNILTLGQYLQPSRSHLPVEKYYSPDEFLSLARLARDIGFKHVAAGPSVRSSYQARDLFESFKHLASDI